ncbi:MAG: translation initiation factor IF-3 [Patescibacteria group bacterium]
MRKSFRGHHQKPTGPKEFRINEKIISPKLTVIDENDANLGIMSREQALAEAKERGLDLVEVSPKAESPIAKFMDYGSFKYQKEKQERKAKAKQKSVETKTVKITFKIAQHDLEIRAAKAADFLLDGDKVRIETQLRGRENQHADLAKRNIWNAVDLIKRKVAASGKTEVPKPEGDITRQGGKLALNITL